MSDAKTPSASLAHRAGHELKELLVVSGYLYICFSAVLFYKSAILRSAGINYLPYGVAIVKALILGKFILLGHMLKIGQHSVRSRLLIEILRQSVIFLVLLIVLSCIEEIIVGLIHGRPVMEALAEVAGPNLPQILATSVLMLLVLIPYFAYREIDLTLGQGNLRKLLMQRAAAKP